MLCHFNLLSQTVYTDYTDGEIYVKFKKGSIQYLKGQNPRDISKAAFTELQSLFTNYSVQKITKPFYQADDVYLQHVLKFYFSNTTQVEALISALRKNSSIEYAEKVPLTKTTLTPNDPQYGSQWHLTKINASTAWNVFSGNSNITVAVVDNAVNITHQDLSPVLWVNSGEIAGNSIDDDGNGYVDDVNGWDTADNDNNPNPTNNAMDHGTHCAGIAAAATNNGIGIASIGFGVRLIGVKCQTNGGSTTGISNGYDGIIYAAKVRARVISCSWGGAGSAVAEQAVINYAWNRGCIVIAAAGNSGVSTVFYPAGYANAYAVASTGTGDVKSSFSNYGTWIDISAPGENILSTYPANTYGNSSGTSMAAPLVAGLAGLMLGKNPLMTQTAVLNCISSTATNIATVNSATLAGLLGAGRIDAFAAMNCATSTLSFTPVANFYSLNRFPCPGTSVQFVDSSLYAYSPSIYNWTFQGGTPATSTSSAPVVSWTAAGTYSVSMQITTPNGNNTKIKTSYITVTGPGALPLSEGFQTTTFLPTNWTPNNIDNDAIYWARATTVGGFGTSAACAVFDNYNLDAAGTRDEMRTPKYDFSAVATASLTFDVAYSQFNATFSDTLELRLSTNCGSSWTSIYLKGGTTLGTAPNTTAFFTPTATQWRKEGINLSSYAGQGNVMIAFVNRGRYGQPVYVDNVNISFTNTPVPIANYTAVNSTCVGSTITYTNTSTNATSYSWAFQGGSPATSTATNPSVTYTAAGVYTTTLTATSVGGTNTIVGTLTISAAPTLTLSANPTAICAGQSATISTSGVATTYTLSPGGNTTPPFIVSPTSTTIYTIAASNICGVIARTVNITVTPNPTVTVNSSTICAGNSTTLTASGATSYNWSTGTTTNPIVVNPTLTTVYTVTGTTGSCTNIKTTTVTVNPIPVITLTTSANSVCLGNSATITAFGATAYTLQPGGSTSNPFIVTPGTLTIYTVTGSNGTCFGSNIITINVTPNPTVTVNSSTICAGTSVTLTANGATSYNWSTGATTNPIVVNPTLTTVYTVTGTIGSCTNIKTTTVTVNSIPVITPNFSGPNPLCFGNTATFSPSGANTYTLMPTGLTNPPFVITPTTIVWTTYTISGTSVNGCIGTNTLLVAILPNPSVTVNTATICMSNTATLTASGAATYVWNTGATSNSITVSPTLSTVYTVTGTGGGCPITKTTTVTVLPSPSVTASFTNASCSMCNNGAAGSIATGGNPSYSYFWNTGAMTPTITNVLPGCYTVVVTDAQGCKASASTCVGFANGLTSNSLTNEFQVFPNPAHEQLFIRNTLGLTFYLELFDAVGKLIYQSTSDATETSIPVAEYSKGVYLLKITRNGNRQLMKVVIE